MDKNGIKNLFVRRYKNGEEQELWNLFFDTIHNINIRDYSLKQINAWAPENLSSSVWNEKIQEINPFVVELNGKIIAYSDLQNTGYIDHFFCHYKFQGIGIARLLMEHIIAQAKKLDLLHLSSDVSVTAKPFYKKMGFKVLKEQLVLIRGCQLKNYHMAMDLKEI